ncbi:MAG: hypothetical protein A2Z29_08440 [Chloroflexi bacterium RBG_16_56_11]|nr:MAG: hypothetical protein A2Z29_08440 [Chloroflexi bacterium RBG_16_56_11]
MVIDSRSVKNYAIRQAERRRAGEMIAGIITMEITFRCNLRCRHCYLGPYTYGDASKNRELTTDEVKGVLDQLIEAGTFFVDFTGGEALCRPDIFEIMAHAGKIGLFFGLKTNATMINETVADKLKDLGVSGVHISLYGATPQTHEFVTEIPGSFEKTISAAKMLRERRIRVRFNTTMMKCNVKEHKQIEALANQLNASSNFDPFIMSKVGEPGSGDLIRLDDEDLKTLVAERNWVPDEEITAKSSVESHIICTAGRKRCAISPSGEVIPCTSWRLVMGDLRKRSFSEIWNGEVARKVRSVTAKDMPTCVSCEFVKFCARCPGFVDLEKEGSGLSGPSSVNCRVARAIKEVRDARAKENLH